MNIYLVDMINIYMNFDILYEETVNRYGRGGFASGDYIKIKADALENDEVKRSGESYKQFLKSLIEKQDGSRLKIVNLNSLVPSKSNMPNAMAEFFVADIAEETLVGMRGESITVPLDIIEVDHDAWSRVPLAWKGGK
jgi:hypothetical protein